MYQFPKAVFGEAYNQKAVGMAASCSGIIPEISPGQISNVGNAVGRRNFLREEITVPGNLKGLSIDKDCPGVICLQLCSRTGVQDIWTVCLFR